MTGLCFRPAVILVGLLRYAHLLERLGPSLLNTLGLATGWVCAAGLTMVGNFQVRHLLGSPWGSGAGEGLGWSGAVAVLSRVRVWGGCFAPAPHPCSPSPPLSQCCASQGAGSPLCVFIVHVQIKLLRLVYPYLSPLCTVCPLHGQGLAAQAAAGPAQGVTPGNCWGRVCARRDQSRPRLGSTRQCSAPACPARPWPPSSCLWQPVPSAWQEAAAHASPGEAVRAPVPLVPQPW